MPMENRPLLRRITSTIGISGYELTTGYIKAIRGDGGPALHIHPGYTGGFSSEGEAMEAAGDVERWFYERRKLWSVLHPVHSIGDGTGARNRQSSRPAHFCPNCFLEVPTTGVCDDCGWEASSER